MSEQKKRTLVLCVDRDNDIGVKTGIKTPIIGRELNLEVASKLALTDPEESDANAIFGTLKTFDSLTTESENDEYEIATIAGSEFGGIKADKQLSNELINVLTRFPANSVIIVTDGFSDEEVLPIIQSHIKILSIKRIVVKHSARIEESWAVFWRYISKLIEDPHYARWSLGAPGILLIALAISWYISRSYEIFNEYVGIVFLTLIGALFLIKGFNIGKKVEEWVSPNPPNIIRLFTTGAALIIIGLDSYQTYIRLISVFGNPSSWFENVPLLIGWILREGVNLMVIATLIFIAGIIIRFYFLRDSRIWWNVVGVVVVLWMREIALKASDILLSSQPIPTSLTQNLLIVVGLGIVTTLITILVTINLSKRFDYYFKNEVKKDEES